jgi:hypothetical protein
MEVVYAPQSVQCLLSSSNAPNSFSPKFLGPTDEHTPGCLVAVDVLTVAAVRSVFRVDLIEYPVFSPKFFFQLVA